MKTYQKEKKLVKEYFLELEKSNLDNIEKVFEKYISEDYNWKGVYPFREKKIS